MMQGEVDILAIIGAIQKVLHDQTLSFIVKLLLQETMDQTYPDAVLSQLARNCFDDHNLLSFLEKQLVERPHGISMAAVGAIGDLLQDAFSDDVQFDRLCRIMRCTQ